MRKAWLRRHYVGKMKALDPFDRAEMSARIAARLFVHFNFVDLQNVHVFLSIDANGEVDTRAVIERVWRDFPATRLAVPRVAGDGLETLILDSQTGLTPSIWGVPEPLDDRFVDPASIDLVIVPLLAFDLQGHRVGYGKGFYDRFLRTCRGDCIKVGVSFFPPVENIEDTNENDVRLDYCLTPYNSFKF